MNNPASIQHDFVVIRNGIPLWRNVRCPGDDALDQEEQEIVNESMRRSVSRTYSN